MRLEFRMNNDSLADMFDHSSETDLIQTDTLGEILQDLRISGVAYGHCRMRRPWGVGMPADGSARFHFVVSGVAWLRLPGTEPLRLETGDAVLLPRGPAHEISDGPQSPTKPLNDLPRHLIGEKTFRLEAGGDGEETVLSCCTIDFGTPSLNPLRDVMPAMLVIRKATQNDPLIPALLDALADEVMSPKLGSATVMARLADVVVTRSLRAWAACAATNGDRGWLAAIRDPRIGKVLGAFHRCPEEVWTVERMSAVAGMSRSNFCDRFTTIVGVSPARYVAQWRMRLASILLNAERSTITEIAVRLGYESNAGFSRAFKRAIGHSPSKLRRSA